MKNFLFFILLGFLTSISAHAQKETNIWYFGNNAGLDFNNGTPVILTDGKVPDGFGSSVISDEDGKLLFYTNGTTVWNKNHDTLSNGKNLSGNPGAAQSALIVQDLGNSDLYYIFTTDYLLSNSNGFRYSMVNMSLDAGLGGVTLKNVPLFFPSTERITATLNANNTDLWILAHEQNTDAFYAYSLSASGLNLTPVISHSGGTKSGVLDGYMKISPDGNKLAIALNDTIELLDFNNATGIVSNPLSITTTGTYGIEFSPDGSKLYFTSIKETSMGVKHIVNKVYQVDLLEGSNTQILNSTTQVFADSIDIDITSSLDQFLLALQVGSDGKIYVLTSEKQYLDVINTPNAKGADCNYSPNALYLGGKTTSYGLPNFAPVYSIKKFVATQTCARDTTYFSITNTTNICSVLWDFGDSSSTSNNSTKLNPFQIYSESGLYDVSLTITYSDNSSRIVRNNIHIDQSPPTSLLGNDTTICKGGNLNYNLSNAYSYVWSDGAVSSSHSITSAGTFWTEAAAGKCKQRDSVVVKYHSTPSLGVDTSLCIGDTLRLNIVDNNANYVWNNGSVNSHLDVSSSGTYSVQVTDQCGTFTITKTITTIPCCTPYIPNLLTINNDGLNETLVISCIEDGQWKLEVFNRWGERVFQSLDYHNEPNGQQLQEGIYYYALSKKSKASYKGWLQVMR